jgi:hypothetical protein
MKRLFLAVGVLLFLMQASFARSSPELKIINSAEENFTFEVTFPEPGIKEIEHEQGKFWLFSFEGAGCTDEKGRPQLPLWGRLIAVPGGTEVKVEILDFDCVRLPDYTIWPFQAETDEDYSAFAMDKEFYQQDKDCPGRLVGLSEPMVWRDLDVVGLRIFPVQYNPARGEITVYTRMVIKVTYGGELFRKPISSRYKKLYRPLVLNYDAASFVENDSSSTYLMIVGDEFFSEIQRLADWYRQRGVSVDVVKISEVGVMPKHVKYYIDQHYQQYQTDWVLLVGDVEVVPAFMYFSTWGDFPSDSWYSFLRGDDFYAELAIGRLSVKNVTELSDQLTKILDYKDGSINVPWRQRTVLIAHGQKFPVKYSECKRKIFNFKYSYSQPMMDTLMGGCEGVTNADIARAINLGRNIVNYRGHGSSLGWTQWNGEKESWEINDVLALENGQRTPIVFNIACNCHKIHLEERDCFGEVWLKKYPGGAVASLGASSPSYTTTNHYYDEVLYKAILDEGILEIGWASNLAAAFIVANCGSFGITNTKMYLWLGDPAMEAVFANESWFIPRVFTLHQNSPNPFSVRTTIRYGLSCDILVSAQVYDISGRRVRELLLPEYQALGYHLIDWDGRDDRGRQLPQGIYFLRMQAGEETTVCKMIIVK